MGPKKKQKKGKAEKEKPPKTLKSEYVAKIAEKNAVLAEARRKIQEVEDVFFGTEKRYEQTQEDMADVIKYLQHEIEENELEIQAYDEKIAIYKKEMDRNEKYYQSIFNQMQTEFEAQEQALQCQIEQNTAKMSALDEVKQLREEYLKKKDRIYQKMRLLEERHQKEIYATEKDAIIRQDTMQKEMESNLKRLVDDFRQASDIALGDTTNKLIRDNISLGNALTCTQEIFERARESYQKVNEVEKQYRYTAELFEAEHSQILRIYTRRVITIESLLKSHEELHEKIKASEKLIKDNRRLQRQIAEQECILREKTAELKYLLKVLNEHTDIFNVKKNAFNSLRKLVYELEVCLYEAAFTAREGIEIENLTHLPDEDESAPVLDDKERDENLKEFKFKKRESAIEKIIEKLLVEAQAPSLDLQSSIQGSTLSANQNTTSTGPAREVSRTS